MSRGREHEVEFRAAFADDHQGICAKFDAEGLRAIIVARVDQDDDRQHVVGDYLELIADVLKSRGRW